MIKHLSKLVFRSLLMLVLITSWLFSGWPKVQIAEASTIETFLSSTSWTAPTGVTSVQAEVWGGGGGGGGQNLASDGGGGGGGGAYSKKTAIVVIPGNNYTVTVGTGGTGNAGCTASTAGGDSWFNSTGTVLAKGGSPGACSTGTPPAGGAGGAAASGVGDVGSLFNGGQGEKGRNSTTGRGGYGGSSAGTAADGWSGPQTWSTATYPTANTPTGGGHGGNGGNANLAPGSAPASGNGGGGGGAAEGAPSNISGGNGAGGKIILTYNKPPTLSISQPDGTGDTVTVGDSYDIAYALADADDVVTAAFYYDTNSSGLDGTAITGACATAAENLTGTCSWDTTGMTPGSYYVYGITNDGVNPQVSAYSPGQITINSAAVVSVSVSDGIVTYGTIPANTAKTTLSGELNDMQTATNDGNVTENFNIKGQNATGGGCTWTLASTNGSDQYIHQFCNATDNSCTSPPTNYTALTTTYQTLKTGVAASGTVNFHLRLTTPNPSSCFGQQSADITVQAVQQ